MHFGDISTGITVACIILNRLLDKTELHCGQSACAFALPRETIIGCIVRIINKL